METTGAMYAPIGPVSRFEGRIVCLCLAVIFVALSVWAYSVKHTPQALWLLLPALAFAGLFVWLGSE